MKRLLSRILTAVFTLALIVGLSGCDVLEVDNPNNLIEEDLQSARSASAMANGAEASVTRALGAVLAPYSAATDELTWIGSRDAWNQLDIGQLNDPANEFSDAAYPYVTEARWTTQEYIGLMEGFNSEGTLSNEQNLIRTYLYGAIIYTSIADMYDNFVFSDQRETGSPIGKDGMNGLYDTALGYVSSALDLGPEGDLEAALLGMRARIHYSKALWAKLNPVDTANPLVNNSDAVTAAQAALGAMTDDFEYELVITGSLPDLVVGDLSIGDQVNSRAELGFGESYVQPAEDGTYAPGDDSEVSEVTFADILTGEVHPTMKAVIDNFIAEGEFTNVTVVTAREMHLILAEAALAGNTSLDFTTQINAIRSLDGLTLFSGQVDELDMLKQARRVNLYLQGRRLADHYRFDEPSLEWTSRANPPGTFLPIAITEIRSNPNVSPGVND